MPYYSLPKLAADKGMNIKTLRGWVSKGILRHSAMTAGEQARYSDADFEAACACSMGIAAVTPRPVVIRGNGDVAAFCRKLKKQLRGGGKTAQPQKRRRRRAA